MSNWKYEVKASRIAYGILIIAIAVFCILQSIGVLGDITSTFGVIPIWKLILGACLLVFAIKSIIGLDMFPFFTSAGFIFMLFEKNIAFACGIEGDIINNWLVFGCSCLLGIGFEMLVPKRKFQLGKRFKVNRDKGHIEVEAEDIDDDKIEVEVDDIDDDFDDEYGGDFGANTRYFDGATFKRGYVMTSMGATDVRFENADKYQGGGVLKVECRMGAMNIEVPSSWRVVNNVVNRMGAVSNHHVNEDPDAPVLTIVGVCKMGAIEIE